MKRNIVLWTIAVLITIITAIYQRVTGPTYPISGNIELAGEKINYKLNRSHGGNEDYKIAVKVNDSKTNGTLFYKRYKTADEWTSIEMNIDGENLTASLPHQPPAGKLEYYLELKNENNTVKFPEENSVVIRFKGAVPLSVLIPHIIGMVLAMLFSNRTGLEFFNKKPNFKKLTFWTLGFLFVGGLFFGPIVQKFAFGEYWTGFPFGHDLTDNKTLIAFLGWLVALFMYGKSKVPKMWALFGVIILLIVYLIPHSVMGSEIDYNKLDKEKLKKEILK
ncbi:MAG: hypothetical protein V3V16_15890 [Melioribacteraceae bacterium]